MISGYVGKKPLNGIVRPMQWMRVLANIEYKHASRLAYELDVTYSHLVNILKMFQEKKWIITTKNGRKNVHTLTPKGRAMREACFVLMSELESDAILI